MQDLSFDFPNAFVEIGPFRISAMIYTFSNAYSLDPAYTQIYNSGNEICMECPQLLTHGGQTAADGSASVVVLKKDGAITVKAGGKVEDPGEEIRCLKIEVTGSEPGEIVNLIDARPRAITPQGIRFKYPEGWRDAGTPLVILSQPRGNYLYFCSLDRQVREKTFVFSQKNGKLHAELVFEELATEMKNEIAIPEWEIGFSSSVEEISRKHMEHIQSAYHLLPWEKRPDVPGWAREISLIAAIHGQHWTGYIFNDYASILANIERLCEKIEPRRILAFLPGWEGRYYWKYGNYCPDERMGGEKGFHALCDGAEKLGVHVMPMFGINVAGVHHDGFAAWGEPCVLRTASGNFSRGSVDWDGSRHYDHSSNCGLNPASPKWQNRLVSQVTSLAAEFGFHGVFLDIAAVYGPMTRTIMSTRGCAGWQNGCGKMIRRCCWPEKGGMTDWQPAYRCCNAGIRTVSSTGMTRRMRQCSTRMRGISGTSAWGILPGSVPESMSKVPIRSGERRCARE